MNLHKTFRRGGFTLIELLVVLALLGVLAGLLVPAIGVVRAQVRQVNCSSNLSQIGLAMLAYTRDARNRLPQGWQSPSMNVSWDDLLADYDGRTLSTAARDTGYLNRTLTKGQERLFGMYTCPADAAGKRGPVIDGQIAPDYWTRTYAFNGRPRPTPSATQTTGVYSERSDTGSGSTNYGSDWAATLTMIARPSSTLLLVERVRLFNALGRTSNSTAASPVYQAEDDSRYATFYGVEPAPLHRGRWNYLMADGHVELLDPSSTIASPPTNSAYSPGGRWAR